MRDAAALIAGIAMIILAPIAAALIQMAISRSREYEADATGARICGNPLWLGERTAKAPCRRRSECRWMRIRRRLTCLS